MRVLVFGDSITQGYWAIEHGWVDRIRMFYDTRQFEDLDGRDEPTIFNLGISVNNSSDVVARIEAEISARQRPHHTQKPIVIVQIGVNDSSTGSGQPSVGLIKEEYRKNLEQIAYIAKALSVRLIFVGSSCCDDSETNPVSWGDYYYKNQDIKSYEDIMAQVAADQRVDFVPVFDKFKQQVDAGGDLLSDGLHPNEAGHKLMYEIIMPKLQELLK